MSPRQAPATIRTTADAYRLRVSPALGQLTLPELTRERLDVWLAGLLEERSRRDATHKAVRALRVILSTAVEWGRLAANPASLARSAP